MERIGIRSFEEMLSTWNRAAFFVAQDAAFWNQPGKEWDKYRPVSRSSGNQWTAEALKGALSGLGI